MMKAFPRADGKYDSSQPDEKGMDLRDYFAAKIINAMIQASATDEDIDEDFSFSWAITCGVNAETDLQGTEPDGTNFNYSWARHYAEEAYCIADAMMKAREIKP